MSGKERFAALRPPPAIPFRHGLENSIEMLRAALTYLDVKVDAAELAGNSGVAFRVYWPASDDENGGGGSWNAGAPAVSAIDPLTTACRPYGWKVLSYRGVASRVAWQFVCQAIERGKPVLSYGFVGEPEQALIVGYERAAGERRLSVVTRHAPDPRPVPIGEGPWPGSDERGNCVDLFEAIPIHRRLPTTVAIQQALRRAVWSARPSTIRVGDRFNSGTSAYASWIRSLLSVGPPEGARAVAHRLLAAYTLPDPGGADRQSRIGVRHVLHRALESLAHARIWAAEYLRGHAREMDTGAAADFYEAEADALRAAADFWPPVVAEDRGRFRLVPEPEGFEERSRREETVRCLRIACEAMDRATREIEARIPPVPQEMEEPD